ALTGAGEARFVGSVGTASALSSLTVSSAGSAGTTRLGSTIAVTGDATFNDRVLLDADTTIHGDNVTFVRAVDGARGVAVHLNASGPPSFVGPVGAPPPLASLSAHPATGGGPTPLAFGSYPTPGQQTWGQDVILEADTITTAGNATFERKVDSDGT